MGTFQNLFNQMLATGVAGVALGQHTVAAKEQAKESAFSQANKFNKDVAKPFNEKVNALDVEADKIITKNKENINHLYKGFDTIKSLLGENPSPLDMVAANNLKNELIEKYYNSYDSLDKRYQELRGSSKELMEERINIIGQRNALSPKAQKFGASLREINVLPDKLEKDKTLAETAINKKTGGKR